MAIEKDLLDQLLAGRDPKDVFNKGRPGRRAEEGAVRADFEYRTRRAPGWRRRGRQDQLPQRLFEEVGADRHLEDDVIGAEGSGWHVRPQANCQIPAEVS